MKKRFHFFSLVLFVVFITLGVVIDYFPHFGLNKSIATGGIVSTIVIAILTLQKGETVFKTNKQELRFHVIAGIYFFSLLLILSAVGGESQGGIGIDNPIIWGLYLLSVFSSYKNYRREKYRDDENANYNRV